MNLTLKELNRTYSTLIELCEQKLPKDNGELITRLSRIRRTARIAIENWEEDQKTIAVSYGFKLMGPGQVIPIDDDAPPTNRDLMDFQAECLAVMKSQTVHFRGERFTEIEWKQFKPLFNLSARMEDDLEWLIPADSGPVAASEEERAIGVSA